MLTIHNARVLTLRSSRMGAPSGAGLLESPRRGGELAELSIIPQGYVRISYGRISEIGEGPPPAIAQSANDDIIDAGGCVLMPAFIDCHTHACWAGNRLDDFQRQLGGASYLELLKSEKGTSGRGGGGSGSSGIMATVRAVREASEDELVALLLRRLAGMAALGTATVEIKSGYGLNTDTELKMLRAVHGSTRHTVQTLVGTFLGAHAIDPENPRFIDQTIQETLPAIASEFPGIACDAYCEDGAWSLADVRRLFQAARELSCPLRLHADQFNSLGAVRMAVEMGAVSVDHLEALKESDLKALAASNTIAVALPCSGFHLDGRYAPGRQLVDAGAAMAIASNFNPGSAPCPSMAFTVALACRKLGLTPAEAIVASTYNAACVLGLQQTHGSIEIGKRADLQLLDATDERMLAYEFAGAGPLVVVINGDIVHLRGVQMEE